MTEAEIHLTNPAKLFRQTRPPLDEANAVVLTWAQYEGSHFQESEMTILNQGTPTSSPAYKAAHERVSAFVTKINGDLNGTPRLFDAVNLMRGSTGENPDTLGFSRRRDAESLLLHVLRRIYFALGKQAWLASKALNGNDADVTQSLQKIVTYWSSNFTDYVNHVSLDQCPSKYPHWALERPGRKPDRRAYLYFRLRQYPDRGARYYPP